MLFMLLAVSQINNVHYNGITLEDCEVYRKIAEKSWQVQTNLKNKWQRRAEVAEMEVKALKRELATKDKMLDTLRKGFKRLFSEVRIYNNLGGHMRGDVYGKKN